MSAAVTAGLRATLRRHTPGGRQRWERTNAAGARVTLLAGPALVTGLAVGHVAADGPTVRRRLALAALLVGVGAVGAYDDLCGDAATKGLRGHLRALAAGHVTSGAIKIIGVSAAGVASAAVIGRERWALLDGALVAGTANLVNLFDLRPGRALKAVLVPCAACIASTRGSLAAATLGAAAAALPDDLAGRSMLGDCGSNALGTAVGATIVAAAPVPVRRLALAVVVGLTLASECVSFTAVIDRSRVLSRVDGWGRPAHSAL